MNATTEASEVESEGDHPIHSSLPGLKPYVEFYNSHQALALPHTNSLTGSKVTQVRISCDACNLHIPDHLVRGVINDYPLHTEVRFVAPCRTCARIIHNTLRFTEEGELVFMSNGGWMRSKAPWWRKLLCRLPLLRRFV